MYGKYLKKFIRSKDMCAYLENVALSNHYITEIIFFSPVPLKQKRESLAELAMEAEKKNDTELNSECTQYIQQIETATTLMSTEGVFTVESFSFHESAFETESNFEGVFASLEQVMDWIHEDMDLNDVQEDDTRWYEVEKWIRNSDGRYFEACNDIVFRGEVCFAELNTHEKAVPGGISLYDGVNLNLPVPFHAGDIIEIDGYPFSPKYHVLILTIGDNRDCCCVQALYKNWYGRWNVGAVKHGMLRYVGYRQISPLYSAKVWEEALSEEDTILLTMKHYINGNETTADKIWGTIVNDYAKDGANDEELLKMMTLL